jgi:hypothetical protein
MEPIQCSETSAYNIQTLGNYPEDNILKNKVSYFSLLISLLDYMSGAERKFHTNKKKLDFPNWKILGASGLELTEFGANFNFSELQIVL